MSEAHVIDMLPAYALGTLDEDETFQVSHHLAACDACRRELRAYEQVVEALPTGIEPVEPPADLKFKILQAAEASKKSIQPASRMSWEERISALFQRAAPAWGLVSLTLILILAISNLLLWQRLQSAPQPNLTTFKVLAMRGTDVSPTAEGVLIIDEQEQLGTLVVDGLDPLGKINQYQLWLIEGEDRTNGGVFSVSNDGYGRLAVELPKPLSAYSGFGITIEPAGGSPGPTGPKVLGVDL